MIAGKYLTIIGDTIHFNNEEFKKDFTPKGTDPSVIANTEYIKVIDGVISVDIAALERDFEPRHPSRYGVVPIYR